MLPDVIRNLPVACAFVLFACQREAESTSAQRSHPIEAPSRAQARQEPPRQPVPSQPVAPGMAPPPATYPRPAIDFSSPEAAMAVLAYAMLTRDGALLLDCFAKGATWTNVNTVEKPWERTKLTYEGLAAGLKEGGDYRSFLFGDDGDDSFRNHFADVNREAWKTAGKLRFEAPDSSPEQPTYVQWRKLGQRYVVSEIAFPAD